ncbi:MAG: hypothetical protein CM1200mP35_07440 [Chloroflexota bacterium]|nr:MAG: hypothetical protein CM1200mP35_07440 [Chloroflexota bacterium]
MSDPEMVKLRRQNIGFIFQSFWAIATIISLRKCGIAITYSRLFMERPKDSCPRNIGTRWPKRQDNHRPYELSGGEQQRVL